MSGKPDIQEMATSYIIGGYIVEEVCSKTGLPLHVAKNIQVQIMPTGEMLLDLPKTKSGKLPKKILEKFKAVYDPSNLIPQTEERAKGHKPDVEVLADIIKEHSFTTKGKPPRDKQILLSIDTLAQHGPAMATLCNELLKHRDAMMLPNPIDASNKGGRAVINALAVESLELLEEYGEEKFREAASNLLSKKGDKGQSKVSLKKLMVNVLAACVPKANVAGLRKRLQRLQRSKK